MTDKNSSDMKDIAGLPAEADDTMEREVHVERNQKLPLHPVIADDEDAQDNLSVSKQDDLITGAGADGAGSADDDSYDADNTETSAVSAFGNSADLADSQAASNASSASAGAASNAGTKATSAASISSFPLPDLREREDGGAINFEEDEPASSKINSNTVSEEVRSKSRAEFTTVYDIIDAMETTLSEAKNVLFAPGMVKIDRDDFVDQLARLKDMLPVQLERASALMREAERRLRTAQSQANSIVSSAQSQAAEIIDEAQERAQFLAGQENVTALAKQKARNILSDAQAKSDKLTQGADQYCATVMEGLKQQLDKLEQDVQAGQRVLEDRRRAAAHVQNDISESLYEDTDNDERNE
ncbi:hypothetical protein GK675_00435 [Bifidobacteriaceae bacterium NR002]|nr:hypothetical protein [Bifidobacteriaceae bacterium NR002]MDZ7549950.1 hypothetical protein [Bifidobacteriaceae bacterium NR047]